MVARGVGDGETRGGRGMPRPLSRRPRLCDFATARPMADNARAGRVACSHGRGGWHVEVRASAYLGGLLGYSSVNSIVILYMPPSQMVCTPWGRHRGRTRCEASGMGLVGAHGRVRPSCRESRNPTSSRPVNHPPCCVVSPRRPAEQGGAHPLRHEQGWPTWDEGEAVSHMRMVLPPRLPFFLQSTAGDAGHAILLASRCGRKGRASCPHALQGGTGTTHLLSAAESCWGLRRFRTMSA